jgi:hypothetical protein
MTSERENISYTLIIPRKNEGRFLNDTANVACTVKMIKPHLSCNGFLAYCVEISCVGNLPTLESGRNEKNTEW